MSINDQRKTAIDAADVFGVAYLVSGKYVHPALVEVIRPAPRVRFRRPITPQEIIDYAPDTTQVQAETVAKQYNKAVRP